MLKKITLVTLEWLFVVLIIAQSATAIEVTVTHENGLTCDPLSVPSLVDELGTGFPADELISSERAQPFESAACPNTDSPDISNVIVEIQNLTQRSFSDVWYVSDPETTISNADGLVNDQPAFRIDSSASNPGGANLPLFLESIASNDIFEPGEIWRFIIDDYSNGLGLPANAFASAGLVGALSGSDSMSSGSIIAVPEPGSFGTMILLACLVGLRRRG